MNENMKKATEMLKNDNTLKEKLSAEVEAHRNGAEPSDDLTMMCIYLN